jgi:hypothetical protein
MKTAQQWAVFLFDTISKIKCEQNISDRKFNADFFFDEPSSKKMLKRFSGNLFLTINFEENTIA